MQPGVAASSSGCKDFTEVLLLQTRFQLDEGTARAIADLKDVFGASTSTEVIRRAIALARIAARSRDSADNTVTIVGPDRVENVVELRG